MNQADINKLVERADKLKALETEKKITWCGNCGNYGIQNALMRALVLEGFERNDYLLCFDVGCNGNGSDKMEAYTIHGLHGRVLSLAAGCAVANPKMKVIASAGDGATFSEGPGHLIHAVRNNYPMVFIFHNNENYGLTTGQASACSRKGMVLNSSPDGVFLDPIHAVNFVLNLKPSFVARSYSGEVGQLTDILREALKHDGFAFVEVMQSCPTYNRETPDHWYAERVKDVADLKGYDAGDLEQARKVAADMDKDIYTGILYRDRERASFMEMQKSRLGKKTALVDEVKRYSVKGLY